MERDWIEACALHCFPFWGIYGGCVGYVYLWVWCDGRYGASSGEGEGGGQGVGGECEKRGGGGSKEGEAWEKSAVGDGAAGDRKVVEVVASCGGGGREAMASAKVASTEASTVAFSSI